MCHEYTWFCLDIMPKIAYVEYVHILTNVRFPKHVMGLAFGNAVFGTC